MKEKMSLEELEKLEEVKLEITKESFKVDKAICPICKKRMTPFVENQNLFEGALTFHIIKFKCEQCGKEYLDLEQAEKYDLFLLMSKAQGKPIELLVKCLQKAVI